MPCLTKNQCIQEFKWGLRNALKNKLGETIWGKVLFERVGQPTAQEEMTVEGRAGAHISQLKWKHYLQQNELQMHCRTLVGLAVVWVLTKQKDMGRSFMTKFLRTTYNTYSYFWQLLWCLYLCALLLTPGNCLDWSLRFSCQYFKNGLSLPAS